MVNIIICDHSIQTNVMCPDYLSGDAASSIHVTIKPPTFQARVLLKITVIKQKMLFPQLLCTSVKAALHIGATRLTWRPFIWVFSAFLGLLQIRCPFKQARHFLSAVSSFNVWLYRYRCRYPLWFSLHQKLVNLLYAKPFLNLYKMIATFPECHSLHQQMELKAS